MVFPGALPPAPAPLFIYVCGGEVVLIKVLGFPQILS